MVPSLLLRRAIAGRSRILRKPQQMCQQRWRHQGTDLRVWLWIYSTQNKFWYGELPRISSNLLWTGCRDKDECTEGGHKCISSTLTHVDCINTDGGYHCEEPGGWVDFGENNIIWWSSNMRVASWKPALDVRDCPHLYRVFFGFLVKKITI